MIVDLATYDGPPELPCDVCIAGAGAAGITIALQFIGRREEVVVLEGGGLEYSEESQGGSTGARSWGATTIRSM